MSEQASAAACDPAHAALLLYDMQNGIRSQIRDGDAIVAACAAALAAARNAGMRVAFTRHLSAPRAWLGRSQLATAMMWQRQSDPHAVTLPFQRDAEASAIVAELAPGADELVVEKLGMSAFADTVLGFAMRDVGLTHLVIAGIALEIGIEPTVRHATDLGFTPVVLTDACGYGDAQAAERSLATMRFIGEARLMTTAAFTAGLGKVER